MDAKLKYKSKKIKIVFFDIDDTLRVKATGYIPESIKTVFKQLKEKGILTGIASGRGIFGVVPELKALQPDFFVTLNGSYIEDKAGKVIAQTPIDRNLVETYIAWKLGLTLASLVVMRQRFRCEHRLLTKPLILFILIYLFSQIFIKITTFIKCGHLKILEIACNCLKS